MLENRVQMKTEALLDFCRKRGFGLLLTDGKNSFDRLLKTKIHRKLEKEILAAIDGNILRKNQYKEIMKKCDSTNPELYRIIIKHNLKFKTYPFKLQNGNQNHIFRQVYIQKKKFDDIIDDNFTSLFKNKSK